MWPFHLVRGAKSNQKQKISRLRLNQRALNQVVICMCITVAPDIPDSDLKDLHLESIGCRRSQQCVKLCSFTNETPKGRFKYFWQKIYIPQ